jgi:hypothetical protein
MLKEPQEERGTYKGEKCRNGKTQRTDQKKMIERRK